MPQKPVFKAEKQQSEKVISEKTPDKEPLKEIKPAKGEKSKGEESKEKYPYQDIVAMWNSVCLSCPKVLKVTEARKQKMKTRFQEFGMKREELTDYVMRLFQRVQASDFLTGRSTDKMGWVANFDWVFENEKTGSRSLRATTTTRGAAVQTRHRSPYKPLTALRFSWALENT